MVLLEPPAPPEPPEPVEAELEAVLDAAVLDAAVLDAAVLDAAVLDDAELDDAELEAAELEAAELDEVPAPKQEPIDGESLGASHEGFVLSVALTHTPTPSWPPAAVSHLPVPQSASVQQ